MIIPARESALVCPDMTFPIMFPMLTASPWVALRPFCCAIKSAMPGANFDKVFSDSWNVANCWSPATDTSPATTPFSSILSVRATRLSFALVAALAPLAMTLGTFFRTASNLVSASWAALNPSMASRAKLVIPATEMAPPKVRMVALSFPADFRTLLNLVFAVFPHWLSTLLEALICAFCFLISAVVPFSFGVNLSLRVRRMLTFLFAIQTFHLQFPRRQKELEL